MDTENQFKGKPWEKKLEKGSRLFTQKFEKRPRGEEKNKGKVESKGNYEGISERLTWTGEGIRGGWTSGPDIEHKHKFRGAQTKKASSWLHRRKRELWTAKAAKLMKSWPI